MYLIWLCFIRTLLACGPCERNSCVFIYLNNPSIFQLIDESISVHVASSCSCGCGCVSASLRLSVCCLSVSLSACAVRCLFATDRRPFFLCTRAISTTNDVVLKGPKSVLRPERDRRCTVARPSATRGSRTDTNERACFCERAQRVRSKNSWQIENNDVVSRTVRLGETTQRQIEREIGRRRVRETVAQTDRETDRQTNIERETDRLTISRRDIPTDRQRDKGRQRNK